LSAAELSRLTATGAVAAAALLAVAWLGPAAIRSGPLAVALLAAVLLPLALGLRGLMHARLRTGRWLSLVLPFYGAGLLVGAVGDPQGRAWVTAGAFCVALGFAALLSWVKRSSPPAPPR
jgi:uncharacterized membrane protein